MIYYLSGPIDTGKSEGYYRKFSHAKMSIIEKFEHLPGDIVVINPCDIPAGLSQQSYMDIAFAQIRACHVLVALKDWETSLGASAEVAYAKKLGLKIIYQK